MAFTASEGSPPRGAYIRRRAVDMVPAEITREDRVLVEPGERGEILIRLRYRHMIKSPWISMIAVPAASTCMPGRCAGRAMAGPSRPGWSPIAQGEEVQALRAPFARSSIPGVSSICCVR